MTLLSFIPRCTLAGVLLVPALLAGCGGGDSGPQPSPTATTIPTTASTPITVPTPTTTPVPITTPVPTTTGAATFALTISDAGTSNYTLRTITGVGTGQVGAGLVSVSATRSNLSLSVASSRALFPGAVITIGNGASGFAFRVVRRPNPSGSTPRATWNATGGRVRIDSISAQTITLRAQNVVFTASNSLANGTFTCNGTIQVTPPSS